MSKYCVYVHITPSNKLYIGITSKKPKDRWGIDGSGYFEQMFYRAVQKYGWNNIKHIVLLENLSKEMACECEQYLINKYQTNNPECGYNLTNGGDGLFGYTHSAESKQKMSDAHKGHIAWNKGIQMSDDFKEKCRKNNLGKVVSEETRKKMSESHKGKSHNISEEGRQHIAESHKGRKFSDEAKAHISELRKGKNNPFYGKKHTTETLEVLRKASTGREFSQEARDKISKIHKGRIKSDAEREHIRQSKLGHSVSEETRRKISESHKGKKLSEETKRKMSEAHKKRNVNGGTDGRTE